MYALQGVPTHMHMASFSESHVAETAGQNENGNQEPMNNEDPDLTGSYAHMEHDEGDGSTIASLFHVQTRLVDGPPSLLIDPGSVGNLSGDAWAKGVAQAATKNGHTPSCEKRPRPLRVSVVGQGA
jgi:hypothetical protein